MEEDRTKVRDAVRVPATTTATRSDAATFARHRLDPPSNITITILRDSDTIFDDSVPQRLERRTFRGSWKTIRVIGEFKNLPTLANRATTIQLAGLARELFVCYLN